MVFESFEKLVLHRHFFLLNFISVLSYRLIVVAVAYHTKFALALSIMIQVLKEALILVNLEVMAEVCYSRGFCLESNHILYSFLTEL